MSAHANIVAFDGAATPVSHTLVPVGIKVDPATNEELALWREALLAVPEEAQIRVTETRRKLKSGILRVATTVEVPVMESVSGANAAGYTAAPKVAFTDTIQIVGFYSPRSTIASKRLVRQLALNIMGNVSTSVTPATSGPGPELFDQNILPS